MRIYLMRHAKAVPASLWQDRDEKRPLSDTGYAELNAAVPIIEKADLNIATIFTSPFERTHDTARVMRTAFEGSEIIVEKSLASGAKPDDFKNLLLTATQPQNYLIIGHNPDLSIFASKCTGVARFLDDYSLETGEIVLIDSGPLETSWMKGKLLWRKQLHEWITK